MLTVSSSLANSWYRLRRSIPLLFVFESKGIGKRGAYCRNFEVNSDLQNVRKL